jgi:MerR family transcriptional regulator, light-induced transcriptional regulator
MSVGSGTAAGLLSVHDAADRLGVHYMTAYRYLRTGRLPGLRQPGGWSIRASDVDALLDERTEGSASPPGRGRSSWPRQSARLRNRLVDGDEPGAWALVEAALVGGTEPADVYVQVLAPALRNIGDAWAQGVVSIDEEHRASAIATRLVGRLGPRFRRRGRPRGTVLLGVAPNDFHSLPASMVADVLRADGYRVVELGAATPADSFLAAAARSEYLTAIAISVGTDANVQGATRAIRALHRRQRGTPVVVGGPALPDETAAEALGADHWAGDALHAAAVVDEIRSSRR